jgi:large repetitive protein
MKRFLFLLLATLTSGCLLITDFVDIRLGGCGDGAVFLDEEQCDDGNNINGDGCNADCQLEDGNLELCGDGILNAGEACDDGNGVGGDGCNEACQEEVGFACNGEPSLCEAICGDGLIRRNETCDDGDGVGGDGCSEACQVEGGFNCVGAPSVCTPI